MATETLSITSVKRWIEEENQRIETLKQNGTDSENAALEAQAELLAKFFEEFNLSEKSSELFFRR
jgi:hypothetical protein